MTHAGRAELIRYGAAAVFLAAVTIAALLVHAGINSADRASTTGTGPVTHATKTKPVPPAKRRYYQVRSGDTLAAIAFRFRTTLHDLTALNPHVSATSLRIGQLIRVK